MFTIAIKEKQKKEELVKTDSVKENTYQGQTQAEDISVTNQNNIYKIYPNPTTGMFRIEVQCQDETVIDVKIFDSTGRLYYHMQDKGSDTYYFDRSITIPGLYQVTITTETQKETLQLVIR